MQLVLYFTADLAPHGLHGLQAFAAQGLHAFA